MKVVSKIYTLVFLMATVFNYPLVLLTISAQNNKREPDFCCLSLNPSYLRQVCNEEELSRSAALSPVCVSGKGLGKKKPFQVGVPGPLWFCR